MIMGIITGFLLIFFQRNSSRASRISPLILPHSRVILLLAAFHSFHGHGAELLHELAGFSHIDEASGNDIRAGQKVVGTFFQGKSHDNDTVLGKVLAVADDDIAHIADAKAIHKDLARGTFPATFPSSSESSSTSPDWISITLSSGMPSSRARPAAAAR